MRRRRSTTPKPSADPAPARSALGAGLPTAILKRYERTLWRLPTWVLVTALTMFAVLAVANLVFGNYAQTAQMLMLVAVVLGSHEASRRQGPASTELTAEGIRAKVPFRAPETVRWEQVTGFQVFSRRSAPTLLLTGGKQVQLLALPAQVARTLAAELPALLGRTVTFEVDGRPSSPAANG